MTFNNQQIKAKIMTFNNKPQWRNVVAVILASIGILILSITWAYHMLVQLLTMPKHRWLSPRNLSGVKVREYPNTFCYVFCNGEAIMMQHLRSLRAGFDSEYCHGAGADEHEHL